MEIYVGRFSNAWSSGRAVKGQAVLLFFFFLSLFLTDPDTIQLVSEGHTPVRDLMDRTLETF